MTIDELAAAYRQTYPYTQRTDEEIRQACIATAGPSCVFCHASGPEADLTQTRQNTRHRRGAWIVLCRDREACSIRQDEQTTAIHDRTAADQRASEARRVNFWSVAR